jgi:hypothetical protein
MSSGDEVRGAGAIAWPDGQQVGMQAVANPGRLGHDILARFDQQVDLAAGVDHADGRQVGLARRDPRDREGITGVGLARPARAQPLPVAELGRYLANIETGRGEDSGSRAAKGGRALDADPGAGNQLAGPAEQRPVAGRVVGERPLLERLAELVDETAGEGRLVSIDPDRAHRPSSTYGHTMGAGQAGSCASSEATLL